MESSYAKNNGSERNILDQMTEGKQLSFYKVCDVCENFLEALLEWKKKSDSSFRTARPVVPINCQFLLQAYFHGAFLQKTNSEKNI